MKKIQAGNLVSRKIRMGESRMSCLGAFPPLSLLYAAFGLLLGVSGGRLRLGTLMAGRKEGKGRDSLFLP